MTVDKKTIGITGSNLAALQRLVESGRFASELDAARFALAHAIDSGAKEGRVEGADTKWNVGSVDPDGHLRSLLNALYPSAGAPYRLMEFLMNEGLSDLAGNPAESPDVYGVMFQE